MAIDLKKVTVNVPAANLEDYFWVIAGIPKAGKTSLFAKLIEEYFGDIDKGLLLALEKGYQALKVKAVDINEWKDLEEATDQLVKHKNELGIKMVGIDTADIMYEYAQEEVIREWNRANPTKRTKDIGGVGAKGKSNQGFGAGYSLIKQKMRSIIDKLMKAGYGVMILTHSKDKKVEQKDGVEYDQLSVSLASSARDIVINMADFIVFVTIEKEKDENEKVQTKRYMYFRTDGYVEAGSRFKNVPERIEYDVLEFIQVFKNAVESEFAKGVNIDEIKKEQAERREALANEYVEEAITGMNAKDLQSIIDTKIKGMSKPEKVKVAAAFTEIIGGHADYTKVDDVEVLEKLVNVVDSTIQKK